MLSAPTTATAANIADVAKLSATVFGKPMTVYFPTLFYEYYAENNFIITDDEKPVALVGTYTADIQIPGATFTCSSVGSVCTDREYRGKGIATDLVLYAEKSLAERGADVIFISGGRSLYTRQGYTHLPMYEAFEPDAADTDVALEPVEPGDIGRLIEFYNAVPVRFMRPYNDFALLHGARSVYNRLGNGAHPTYVVVKNGVPSGYFMTYEREKMSEIIEYGGDPQAVIDGICKYSHNIGRPGVVTMPRPDPAMRAAAQSRGYAIRATTEGSTVKVVNFTQLVQKLWPYFAQILPREDIFKLTMAYDGAAWRITYGDEVWSTTEIREVNTLVLGDALQILDLSETPNLERILRKVFPLPVPSVDNCNYI